MVGFAAINSRCHQIVNSFALSCASSNLLTIPKKILTSFRDSPTAEYRIETKGILSIT